MSETRWHIITSEYPPQLGGVSDYTKLVATGLAAAGDEVHVWCPAVVPRTTARAEEDRENSSEVIVHRDFGSFTTGDMRRVGRELDRFPAPRRLLVQWVPHGYGYRSMNLPFCLWLWRRSRLNGDRVEVMVHEPFLAFREGSIKQDLAALVHRLMVIVLLNAASRVWVSIPDWEEQLRPFVLGEHKSFTWLPVTSNIPVVEDPAGVAAVRARYAARDGTTLIGHFGAYDQYMAEVMLEILSSLIDGGSGLSVLLLGKGSVELRDRLIGSHPQLTDSVHATGQLSVEDVSRHVSACDVMLQPYQDGVSGRRTGVMTAIEHGVPVVTTQGRLTEPLWAESRAIALVPTHDAAALSNAIIELLADNPERERLSSAARAFYRRRFGIERMIKALRSDVEPASMREVLPTEVKA